MITMGDEIGRSQSGSNNAYSLTSIADPNSPENFDGGWALNWNPDEVAKDLFDSVSALTRIRTSYMVDVMGQFFTGEVDIGTRRKDLAWFHRDGLEMTPNNWQDGSIRHLAFCIEATHKQGLFVILNSDNADYEFTLPNQTWGESFRSVFDSSARIEDFNPALKRPSDTTRVLAHSAQVWFVNRSIT